MSKKFLDLARHEPADVGRRFIWAGSALVLVSVFILGLIVLWLYPGATTDRTLRLPLPRYPDPQLQLNPAADMARFRDEEKRQLNGAGWVDKANRVAHIPIADAMRKIAQESIPGWPGAAEPPVERKNAPVSPAPSKQPHEARETVPSSPASTEKAHEPARPTASSSTHGATIRGCGVNAGSQRHCLRPKARHPTPHPRHVPRRHRSHGAAGRSF
jgi:hypothetical protein